MKVKTLPSIRIEEETNEAMQMAIKKFNSSSLVKLTEQEFRRLSYSFFSQLILQNKEQEVKRILQLQ